jgi:hypothetical protein
MRDTGPNQLPSANSRRAFWFQRLKVIRCSLASSGVGSPAAVAERERSVKGDAP